MDTSANDDLMALARAAYEGYRNHSGGMSLATGRPIPVWENVNGAIQGGWVASALAMQRHNAGPALEADYRRIVDESNFMWSLTAPDTVEAYLAGINVTGKDLAFAVRAAVTDFAQYFRKVVTERKLTA